MSIIKVAPTVITIKNTKEIKHIVTYGLSFLTDNQQTYAQTRVVKAGYLILIIEPAELPISCSVGTPYRQYKTNH